MNRLQNSVTKWSAQPVLRTLHIEGSFEDAARIESSLVGAPYEKYELTHASSLKEGLELLKQHEFELILVDMCLPDGSGLEVLDALHDHVREEVIIVLSSIDSEDLGLDCVMHGADDFLPKANTGAARLLRSVRFALQRSRSRPGEAFIPEYLNYQKFVDALDAKIDLEHSLHRSQCALIHFQIENQSALLGSHGSAKMQRLERILRKRVCNTVGHRPLLYRGNCGDHILALYNPIETHTGIRDCGAELVNTLKYPFKLRHSAVYLLCDVGISVLGEQHFDCPQDWIDSAMVAAKMASKSGTGIYYAKACETYEMA